MLNHCYYDLPFYARLREPVEVVEVEEHWSNPNVRNKDRRRKELADAGQFAPTRSEAVLIGLDSFRKALCASNISWIVGPASTNAAYPFLLPAVAIKTEHEATLWRLDASQSTVRASLNCPILGRVDEKSNQDSVTPRPAWTGHTKPRSMLPARTDEGVRVGKLASLRGSHVASDHRP